MSTSAWGLISGVVLFIALGGGEHLVLLTLFEADHLALVTFSLIITALILGWLVVRLLVVNTMVGRYNQRLAAGIPSRVPGQPGPAGRAASSAALAIALPVLIPLLQFVNILPFFGTLLKDYLSAKWHALPRAIGASTIVYDCFRAWEWVGIFARVTLPT